MSSANVNAQNMTQIPLDLGHRETLGRDDFLVTPSNQDAVAWIDRWPDWQSHSLIVYGPSASGKSHLASVWAEKSKASYWDMAQDMEKKMSSLDSATIIERADLLIGDEDAETCLFHLYNLAKEGGTNLLLTMTRSPAHLEFCIPDLASRLRASQAVAIESPDDALLSAIIVKLFSDRQVKISPEILRYILPRMDRSFLAARRLVDKADTLALANKKPISIPLMREVLSILSDELS